MLRWFLAPGLAILAAGCATPPLSAPSARRLDSERFQLAARLQVKDGERSAAVGLDWQHGAERDDWLFTGPLGQGLARIEASAGGARLRFADGRLLLAPSAAELAETVLGVSAPFAELPLWVTARRRPGAEIRAVDAFGRPRQIIDQGWTIDYLEYVDEAPDALPRKIDVSRGDTRLRLIVDTWNP